MADIAKDTTRKINVVFPEIAEIRDFKTADTAIEVGDAVYVTAAGKAVKTNADGVDPLTAQGRGIVVAKRGGPYTLSVMKRGYLAGYVLDGLDYDARLFLSEATAGALADAAPVGVGAISVPCGRVSCLTNDSLTKILYVDFDWITQFA